uniref:HAT C-terminal dimerisation domain-containing protein n=1 Tax=Latimeria chalumnae TaxID=7897 RepID=H3AVA4_LATCH
HVDSFMCVCRIVTSLCNLANGGAIHLSAQLRREYLPKVVECHKQEIMELIKWSGSLSVVTDQSTDSQDQYVLHILFVLQGLNGEDASDSELKAVLTDTMYLQAVNYNTVSQAIVKCLNTFGVDFNISAFISDSATYMSKAYNRVPQGLMPNSVHLTCNAYIVVLASDIWSTILPEVDKVQLNLITRYGKKLVDLIKWLESHEIRVHQAYNKVFDETLKGEQHSSNTGIQNQCIETFTEVADKLTSYYDPDSRGRTSHFTQPAHQFLEAVRVFDPLQVCTLNLDTLPLDSIPGLNRSCRTELESYRFYAKECNRELSLTAFWRSAKPHFPNIANLAKQYLSVVPNSVDAK